MSKAAIAACAFVLSAFAANASPVAPGDSVDFSLDSNGSPQITSTFTAGNGVDYSIGYHTLDVNVGGTNQLLLTVSPGSYCGVFCAGGVASFVLSGLDFVGGELLTGFTVTGAASIFQSFTILDGHSIAFNFSDSGFSTNNDIFVQGNFITASPVPLPAGAALMLTGLAALGGLRRYRRAK
ncbi:VPLPA-CTERM sorting domain-containing protein [Neotabrizicola sp. sgz301269]|uniref:VPLPA-CTERM sorting domain-containing protein n=1 Tax=Neotabrizicola sp. sgz301269 TaxID=3276282 RepID=UPI00376F58F5